MKSFSLIFIILILLATSSVNSKHYKDFLWDEISEDDWAVSEDTSKNITDAVMIFEKIVADDKKFEKDECYHVIYRRIRVLSEDGRKWGDVEVPHFHEDQEIKSIMGQTILKDGTIIELLPEHIFEKQTVKTKNQKITGKSFSIPGVTDDCIIEYYIEYKLPTYINQWIVQKEIALLRGEMKWTLAQFRLTADEVYLYEDYITPNYLWLNTSSKVTVTELPNIKNPEMLLCEIGFVPPYESEPYTIPSSSIKTKFVRYYGSKVAASTYWGNLSNSQSKDIDDFCAKDKRLKKIVKSLGPLSSDNEKITAAFNWVRDSIKNSSYYEIYDPKKPEKKLKLKDRKSVDDVIKRGYGTSYQISIVFCDLLREMNVKAKLAYARNRNEGLFVQSAKYWQFDSRIVLVDNPDGTITLNTPGIPYTSLNEIPWYLEGVTALVASGDKFFINLPFSDAKDNSVNRVYQYDISEDFELAGTVTEKHEGNSAQYLRNTIVDEDSIEIDVTLNEKIADEFDGGETVLDSYENLQDVSKPLILKYKIDQPELSESGGKIFMQPLLYVTDSESPFDSKERKQAVMLPYASWTKETATFKIDSEWSIEALPTDTVFRNQAGECSVSFQAVGNTLNVQQLFVLETSFLYVEHFPLIKELFQAKQDFSNMIVVYSQSSQK